MYIYYFCFTISIGTCKSRWVWHDTKAIQKWHFFENGVLLSETINTYFWKLLRFL